MKMKCALWLPLLCLLACPPAHCQEATPTANDTLLQQNDTAATALLLKEQEQYQAWQEVYQQFLGECLGPFLRQKQIRPNCATCDRILFSYLLKADGMGHITEARQLSRQVACTQLKAKDLKTLDAHIQAYFKRLKLPPVLYNSVYKGPFSLMLKC